MLASAGGPYYHCLTMTKRTTAKQAAAIAAATTEAFAAATRAYYQARTTGNELAIKAAGEAQTAARKAMRLANPVDLNEVDPYGEEN